MHLFGKFDDMLRLIRIIHEFSFVNIQGIGNHRYILIVQGFAIKQIHKDKFKSTQFWVSGIC